MLYCTEACIRYCKICNLIQHQSRPLQRKKLSVFQAQDKISFVLYQITSNLSLYSRYYAKACYKLATPKFASLRPGNTAPLEETLHRWRAVGNTVSDLTGPRFEPQNPSSGGERVTAQPTDWFYKTSIFEISFKSKTWPLLQSSSRFEFKACLSCSCPLFTAKIVFVKAFFASPLRSLFPCFKRALVSPISVKPNRML